MEFKIKRFMRTEYRDSTPPEEETQSCVHCGTEYYTSNHTGYCSKTCYKYDIE